MNILTDPKAVFDAGQAVRHVGVAKYLVERRPVTGERVGSRKARGRTQTLMDLYALGHRHPVMGGVR
jgi:hypothetical protein